MNNMLVKALWGSTNNLERRQKMNQDIELVKRNIYHPPFVCYTFGQDNHKYLLDQGFNSKMLDKRSMVWDFKTLMFRHKLEAYKVALQEFDSIVFNDWDMSFIQPCPKDFWDVLGKGESFQAVLIWYKRLKAMWRKSDWRKIPSGGFCYLRGKEVAKKFIEIWDASPCWSEEVIAAKYTDALMKDGVFSCEEWYRRFESPYWTFSNCVDHTIADKKPQIIQHFNCRQSSGVLRTKDIYPWLRNK